MSLLQTQTEIPSEPSGPNSSRSAASIVCRNLARGSWEYDVTNKTQRMHIMWLDPERLWSQSAQTHAAYKGPDKWLDQGQEVNQAKEDKGEVNNTQKTRRDDVKKEDKHEHHKGSSKPKRNNQTSATYINKKSQSMQASRYKPSDQARDIEK